jgi:hypothetical protein
MTWTLAQSILGDVINVADVEYDSDKEQVVLTNTADGSIVVINCNWIKFIQLIDAADYKINYITNTILVGGKMLDPTGELSDFEIIFHGIDWQVIPPATLLDKIKLALYGAFAWCAAVTF